MVSQPDRPSGRGRRVHRRRRSSAARAAARARRCCGPSASARPRWSRRCARCAPDLGVVVAFGQFLPKPIRELPRLGYLVNAHASVLPRHRGAAPIARAILAGDAETGISVMRVEREMDAGPVALVRTLAIGARRRRAASSSERLAALAADAIAEALDAIADGTRALDASRTPRARRSRRRSTRADARDRLARARGRDRAARARVRAARPARARRSRGEPLRILAARAEPGADRSRARHVRVRAGERAARRDRRRLARAASASSARAASALDIAAFLRGRPISDGERLGAPSGSAPTTRRDDARSPPAGRRGPRRGRAAARRRRPARARARRARACSRCACSSASSARGAYADLLLHSQLARSGLGPRDRAFATELVYGTLRWRGRIDYLLGRCPRPAARSRSSRSRATRAAARRLSDPVHRPRADERRGRRGGALRARGGRRARHRPRERGAAAARAASTRASRCPRSTSDPLGAPHARARACPRGSRRAGSSCYGPGRGRRARRRVQRDAAAHRAREPAPARERDALLDELRARFPDARPCRFARDGVVLGRARQRRPRLPRFLAGRFTVQDEASQLVVGLLDPQPGERVLDTCAAPGGKATAIAERVGDDAARSSRSIATRGRLDLVRRAARAARARPARVPRVRRDAAISPSSRRRRLRPRARRRAVLGARQRCAAIPTRAGACARPIPRGSPRCSSALLARASRVLEARRRARLQYLHAPARGERGGGGVVPARVAAVRADAAERGARGGARARRRRAATCAAGRTATTPTASSPRGSSGRVVSRARRASRRRSSPPTSRSSRAELAEHRGAAAPTGSTST